MMRVALMLLVLALAGCAGGRVAPVDERSTVDTTAPAPAPPAQPEVREAPRPEVRVIPLDEAAPRGAAASEPVTATGAVGALERQAERERAAGQLERAAATMERALRIEPRRAEAWQRLASIRLDQGRADQAASLAERALSLASGDAPSAARSWRLIERAHRARGADDAARAAAENAKRLEGG